MEKTCCTLYLSSSLSRVLMLAAMAASRSPASKAIARIFFRLVICWSRLLMGLFAVHFDSTSLTCFPSLYGSCKYKGALAGSGDQAAADANDIRVEKSAFSKSAND